MSFPGCSQVAPLCFLSMFGKTRLSLEEVRDCGIVMPAFLTVKMFLSFARCCGVTNAASLNLVAVCPSFYYYRCYTTSKNMFVSKNFKKLKEPQKIFLSSFFQLQTVSNVFDWHLYGSFPLHRKSSYLFRECLNSNYDNILTSPRPERS